MRTVNEIKELAIWLEDDYHSIRVREQEIDDTYHRDTFAVPHINEPYTIIRLGTGTD